MRNRVNKLLFSLVIVIIVLDIYNVDFQDSQPVKRIENCSRSDRIIRTSILSKTWRSKWRYLPHLVFDDTFYRTSVLPSAEQPNISKLFLNIFTVLLFHHGPILSFTFHLPLLKSCPEIDRLILYLSEKDVHEFFFEIGESKRHVLPSFLFSCVTLRRLTLSSCSFTVPLAFQGFVNLISLTFLRVPFTSNVFETIISKCPLLERLSIKHCSKFDNLDIDIPYLKFFEFSGSVESFCFRKPCEHLSTFSFNGDLSAHGTSEPTKLFESLPIVKHLHLGYKYMRWLIGRMPRKLSLSCLRVLELSDTRFGRSDMISNVLRLIVSSPNLEKLEIGYMGYVGEEQPLAPELIKVKDLLANALEKLRVVKIKLPYAEVVKPEVEFIKFLLAESKVLEKMLIQPAEGTIAEKGLRFLKEIIQFERSSTKVKILYLDP
ncbi:F-box/FBD/LRR-repeat protein At1g13570-like [Mercurialis annua]|uniref:F-box/FBD/LRR-repeat protein At1g13570-like n=1 Tax=Mercurialis annua TaxID=3986 RepID=UPI0024ADDECC|nr:F-box/FBD/LRR-repeat protein At1g13570-like [Mercurialis annua]